VNSLQARLQIGLLLSLLLVALLLFWGGSAAVRQIAEAYVATRLEHDAEALLGALQPPQAEDMHISMGGQRVTPVYLQPFSGHYYLVRLNDGEPLRSRSLWDHELALPTLATGETRLWRAAGPQDQALLVRAAGYRKQGRNLTLAVAEDIAPIELQIRRLQGLLAAAAAGAIALLLLIQRLVVRHSLGRLERVRADIQRLEQGQTERLSEAVPDEIRPLVQEFNRLLALLASRLERSRNALGNLAHALKGPLNLLVQALDAGDSGPQAQVQTSRIRQLIERELRRARLAGAGKPGQQFDPAAELPDLIAALAGMHRGRELEIRCNRRPAAPLPIDREDLLELLGNLLDNACKWARRRVRFELEQDGEELRITVEDDGPGVSAAQLAQLAQRGVRIDQEVDGHGLGLAISRDIARLYAGGLEFGRAPELGGLQVRVRLRLARPE
jgi:signal transduction histidine kinase